VRRQQLRREDGQALIFIMLAMPLLLAVVALVIDGSNLFTQRRSIQNAADAAALAVAQDLPLSQATAQSEAQEWVDKNISGATAVATTPYKDAACLANPLCTGDQNRVEVKVGKDVTGFFTRAVGLSSVFNVSARAVATVTTSGSGPAALAFAHSTTDCSAMHISGQPNTFEGAVMSNAGVDTAAANTGQILVYGNQIDTSKCLKLHGGEANWGTIEADPPRDWPVQPPTCTPACTPATARAGLLVTSVAGVPCKAAPAAKWTVDGPTYVDTDGTTKNVSPGLYCATSKITVNQAGINLTNVGFVAPNVTWSSGNGDLTGYTGILPQYGGLLFYAYGSGSAFDESGSGNSLTGAIFAPFGNAQVSGGSGTVITGFIAGDTVQLSGGGGTWKGLGPGIGGGTATGVALTE
jgi:Flp pilus assembly protein TadG